MDDTVVSLPDEGRLDGVNTLSPRAVAARNDTSCSNRDVTASASTPSSLQQRAKAVHSLAPLDVTTSTAAAQTRQHKTQI